MKPLATIERIREVLDYNLETGLFTWKERKGDTKNIKIWNKRFAGKPTGHNANMHGFLCVTLCVDNKAYRAHRLAWAYVYGYWTEKEIDHINLNPRDNRISNLREADRGQNECNKAARVDNKLGIKGVHYDKSRKQWMMQIKFKDAVVKKRYKTLEQAQRAYSDYAQELHGEFARVA
jgi:hypothetical protein